MRARLETPRLAAARELARALFDAACLPGRLAFYLWRRRALEAEVRADLEGASAPLTAPDVEAWPARPLRILISCAEESGELHARHVARALRRLAREQGAPEPELFGFGGEKLREEGVEILADPVARAAMGFDGVLSALPFYLGLASQMARACDEREPDLFLPIDSPALHLPFARIAGRRGVRVVHFIPPQYWGWAPWRVRSYRRHVDLTLTILPFEAAWFDRHGVANAHVGHPLLDSLAEVPESRPPADARELALLPGSRAGVIDRNLPWMLERVRELRARVPALQVCILQAGAEHQERIEGHLARAGLQGATGWLRLAVGDLHTELGRVRCALSVSGTVLLDLLHHRLPAVVLYRLRGRRGRWMYDHLLTTPWFASVNLLAGREAMPEFCFHGQGPVVEVGHALERCYNDEEWRRRCGADLDEAARRLGPAGASERAARHALAAAARAATRS